MGKAQVNIHSPTGKHVGSISYLYILMALVPIPFIQPATNIQPSKQPLETKIIKLLERNFTNIPSRPSTSANKLEHVALDLVPIFHLSNLA